MIRNFHHFGKFQSNLRNANFCTKSSDPSSRRVKASDPRRHRIGPKRGEASPLDYQCPLPLPHTIVFFFWTKLFSYLSMARSASYFAEILDFYPKNFGASRRFPQFSYLFRRFAPISYFFLLLPVFSYFSVDISTGKKKL